MSRLVLLFLCLTLTTGCSDEDVPTLRQIVVEGPTGVIDLDNTFTIQLTARGLDQHNEPYTLTDLIWSSLDTSIATVDATGLVTGVTRGSVRITVSTGVITGSKELTLAKALNRAEIASEIQSLILARAGLDKIPGISVSVLFEDGDQINATAGVSEAGTALQSSHRFGLASITKTAVAAVILKLESEGQLSLEDPISHWLTLNHPNVDESITIRQLLSHYAGLNDYFNDVNLWSTVEGDLHQVLLPHQLTSFIGPPSFLPGTRFEYSNSNYVILGLIIQAVTGKTVSENMREKFWSPLNLSSFYFGAEESATGQVAAPWRDTNGDGTLEDITDRFHEAYHSVFYTAADLFSTAEELALWARALYADNGMALNVTAREKMLGFYFVSGFPDWDGYGLGVRRYKLAGQELWGHAGGMRGYTTFMLWHPQRKMSIVILTNQSLATNGGQMMREILLGIIGLTANE